jgi:hypothetical protein
VFPTAGRADADREPRLVRSAALCPAAAAETGSLADAAGLFEGNSSAADGAGDVAGTEKDRCEIITHSLHFQVIGSIVCH